jgi:membrane-bound lytic murein transglycosylase D
MNFPRLKFLGGKTLFSLCIIAILSFGFWLFSYNTPTKFTDAEILKEISRKLNIYSIPIPDKMDFCGETVPLSWFDVKESLDREIQVNTYWQSQTLLFLKRAHRHFPVIEPILKKHGIPDDFKYLAVIESGLTNVTSPSGAKGIWQLMPNTAKELNLVVNDEIDERYSLEKSTEAACRYLKESYNEYKSWTLAAASYNMGKAGLSKSLNNQKANNYYDLLLNEETARYIYRILAIKLIFNNPYQYGYRIRKKDLYLPIKYTEVKIDTSITDLYDFSFKMNTNYKLLKFLNPWLRQSFLTNKESKEYVIKIPVEKSRIVALSDSSYHEIIGIDSVVSDTTIK